MCNNAPVHECDELQRKGSCFLPPPKNKASFLETERRHFLHQRHLRMQLAVLVHASKKNNLAALIAKGCKRVPQLVYV